ncbi:MAG: MarR family transcriptional regulator [Bacteroidales bacterium]|nr:MarR family transcriptional regulator [Bacteroidales bacterium]
MNNELINMVAELSNMMAQMEEKTKDKYNTTGLTLTQMHYLETIGLLNNPNMTELANALKLSKPTVTVSIDKLIEKGCVYKVHSDQDRRTSHLHLTEIGMGVNKTHEFSHKSIAEHFSKKLDKNELDLLIKLINKSIN